MSSRPPSFHIVRLAILLPLTLLLVGACADVNRVASFTGNWLGGYSPKWAAAMAFFVLFCLALLALAAVEAWSPRTVEGLFSRLTRIRSMVGLMRWPIALALWLAPIWFFQYTYWGIVFTGLSFRLLIWGLCALGLAFLLTRSASFLTFDSLLAALLLSGTGFAAALPLAGVISYPFSLGWSEGNRLWDYSTLFGRRLYNYPPNQPLVPFLDFGRQLIGGIPFLFPHVTILGARLWVAITAIVPYLLFGWSAFYASRVKARIWLLAGLWTFMFLRQGPIHAPLLFSAMLVALTWRRPLWIAIPGVMLASWFASISRFTWAFAPAIWTGVLVLVASGDGLQPRPAARDWGRAFLLGACGLAAGLFLRQIGNFTPATVVTSTAIVLKNQPLLWYRLLPNSTYNLGVILNLLIAILPLLVVLVYLLWTRVWRLTLWPLLALGLPLLAFLAVGLVASTKIGGGADLHNLDMFLIGLVFAASLAAERTALPDRLARGDLSASLRVGLVVLVALPAFWALGSLRPLLYAEEFERVKTLLGRADEFLTDPSVLGFLPPQEDVPAALKTIRREIEAAAPHGEILFMDQRQLLTFGFVPNVALVPEYDKKLLMDRAMTDSYGSVFPAFYADLAAHRFSLIISDPLRLPIKDSDFKFGEENNAWVKWVSSPVLCYYKPKVTIDVFRIQLLVPRDDAPPCELPAP